VFRAAGETETTQANSQDWLHLGGDPGFRLPAEEETVILLNFTIIFVLSSLKIYFNSLIQIIS
jgi:hypothetical protein